MKHLLVGAVLLAVAARSAWSQAADRGTVYRCPGRRSVHRPDHGAGSQGQATAARSRARRSRSCTTAKPAPAAARGRRPAAARRPGEPRSMPTNSAQRDSDARKHPRSRAAARGSSAGRRCRRSSTTASPSGRAASATPRSTSTVSSDMRARDHAQAGRHRRAQARDRPSCTRDRRRGAAAGREPLPSMARDEAGAEPRPRYEAFDLLATLVALVAPGRHGAARQRRLRGPAGRAAARAAAHQLLDWFTDAAPLHDTLARGGAQPTSPPAASRPRCGAAAVRRRRPRPAGARDRQPDRRPGPRAGRDDRDRAADAAGPRGARARPDPGQQRAGAQPRARDQEPARRHPRRGAAAGDGAEANAPS